MKRAVASVNLCMCVTCSVFCFSVLDSVVKGASSPSLQKNEKPAQSGGKVKRVRVRKPKKVQVSSNKCQSKARSREKPVQSGGKVKRERAYKPKKAQVSSNECLSIEHCRHAKCIMDNLASLCEAQKLCQKFIAKIKRMKN